jgi:hypothetical protein
MYYMIIETAHEKPCEPVILFNIIGSIQHVHEPVIRKIILLVR